MAFLEPDQLREVVGDALRALVTGELRSVEIFTPDVVAESKFLNATNRDDLLDQLEDRRGGLSNVDIVIDRFDAGWTSATVAWHFTADHTGALLLNEDTLHEPTGGPVGAAVVTEVRLWDGRISGLRSELEAAVGQGTSSPTSWSRSMASPREETPSFR